MEAATAQPVRCHITFAGATRVFVIDPLVSVADVATPLLEGASLALTVANRTPPAPGAGVTIRTYAIQNNSTQLLHQAFYLPHASTTSPHGFTGLQVIREPVRDREIAYWCERASG